MMMVNLLDLPYDVFSVIFGYHGLWSNPRSLPMVCRSFHNIYRKYVDELIVDIVTKSEYIERRGTLDKSVFNGSHPIVTNSKLIGVISELTTKHWHIQHFSIYRFNLGSIACRVIYTDNFDALVVLYDTRVSLTKRVSSHWITLYTPE